MRPCLMAILRFDGYYEVMSDEHTEVIYDGYPKKYALIEIELFSLVTKLKDFMPAETELL